MRSPAAIRSVGRPGRLARMPTCLAGARDQLTAFRAKEPLEPPADLAGDGGAVAARRDGDLKLAAAGARTAR